MARYAYASNRLLSIQIDAAINPGHHLSSHRPTFFAFLLSLLALLSSAKLKSASTFFCHSANDSEHDSGSYHTWLWLFASVL